MCIPRLVRSQPLPRSRRIGGGTRLARHDHSVVAAVMAERARRVASGRAEADRVRALREETGHEE